MTLTLSTLAFIESGQEQDQGSFVESDKVLFQSIRSAWPELSNWGDMALGSAWGAYSQDVYLMSWLEASQKKLSRKDLLDFIAYIKWHEIKGEPEWGQTPEELISFAKSENITV